MVRALPDDGLRHEVIDGEHIVTPAPSWTHQGAVLQLARRWMVDVDARVVERWRAGEDVGAVLTERVVWQPDAGVAALTIDLAEYFRDVTGEADR